MKTTARLTPIERRPTRKSCPASTEPHTDMTSMPPSGARRGREQLLQRMFGDADQGERHRRRRLDEAVDRGRREMEHDAAPEDVERGPGRGRAEGEHVADVQRQLEQARHLAVGDDDRRTAEREQTRRRCDAASASRRRTGANRTREHGVERDQQRAVRCAGVAQRREKAPRVDHAAADEQDRQRHAGAAAGAPSTGRGRPRAAGSRRRRA